MTGGECGRPITAIGAEIVEVAEDDARARRCLEAYFAELNRRFPDGFDPAGETAPVPTRPSAGLTFVALGGGSPIGCGALRFHDGWAEIKRLWVDERVRGGGLGRRLLDHLESRASELGMPVVRLDTNRALEVAIRMYRRAGYVEIPPYNDNPYAHHWFEKRLDVPRAHP